MDSIAGKSFMKVSVTGEHREGWCENCGTKLQKISIADGDKQKVRNLCPECGGQGRLIARTISVHPPRLPQCAGFRGLLKYFWDSQYTMLLAAYHAKRVAYAEKNRHKKILERYRTGEPSPENIWQAIHALIKLRCPICRRVNKDPLLFRRNK